VPLRPGDTFAGHRIESEVARGGMGIVYRARHLALDVTVALKVIAPELAEDAEFRERFRRESRTAATIEGPHLLPIRHAGEEEGLLYITMRFVEGTDLGRLIAERGRLEPALALELIGQVAEALEAAHASGFVHRDVKPANILLEDRPGGPYAYLSDFGLTRPQAGGGTLTQTGLLVGTLEYIAPEQIEGGRIDPRTDVYALGCVLFQALSGELPFQRESEVSTMYAHLEDPPPRLCGRVEGISPQLEAVAHKALAKDPEERFRSAGELRAAALATLGEPAPPLPAGETRIAATVDSPVAGPEPAAAAPGAKRPRLASGAGGRRRWALLAVPGAAVLALIAVLALGSGNDDGKDASSSNGTGPAASGGALPIPAGGGSSGGGSAGGAIASIQAFREQADRVCTGIETGVENASSKVPGQSYDSDGTVVVPRDAQAAFLAQRASIVRRGVRQLRAISAPPVLASRFDAYIGYREGFAAQLEALGAAIGAGDRAAAAAAGARMEALLKKKMAAGRRLGLEACADRLPAGERERVETLARQWLTGSNPQSLCRDGLTQTLRSALFPSVEACVLSRKSDPPAGSARPIDLYGVGGVHATVTFATDVGEVPVLLDYEGGGWKVDGTGSPR
jgi:hypothetical protein